MSDQTVALNFAHYEIDDLIMDHPMFFLIQISPIINFFLNLFVHFHKIDQKVINNRQILIFQSVHSLPNAILISDKVPFLKIDLFLDDIL